jgi:hypothetical protein
LFGDSARSKWIYLSSAIIKVLESFIQFLPPDTAKDARSSILYAVREPDLTEVVSQFLLLSGV